MSATTSITVRVPITIRQRGGRKLVVVPEGASAWTPRHARVDNTLIKALARAHRWRRMLDDGSHGSVSELAMAEKLDRGYLGRILMLTLLAPDIVEAIMDGRQPNVAIKLSNFGAYGPDLALPSLRATLLPCIGAFGPDRAMFATDYPVGRRAMALRDTCERFNVIVADFPAAEQSALFHDTAVHLYRFDRA